LRKRYPRLAKSKIKARRRSKLDRIEDGFTAKLVALHKHALQLSSATTLSAITGNTLDAIEFSLGFDFADITIVKGGWLRMVDYRGFDQPLGDLPLDGKGVTAKVARRKRAIKVDDTTKEAVYVDGKGLDWNGPPSMLSELAVPVLVDGEVAAILNVESKRRNAFNDEDQKLLETLASHVAMAIGRLRRDEALETSRGNLQALFNATTDSTLLMDLDGTILATNEVFARMVQKKPEEIVGTYAYDLIAPDSAKKRKTVIDEVIKSGKPTRFEDERGGEWFENSIYPIFGVQGKVARLAIFVKNVSERKQMEDELRRSTQFMEGIIENANVWMDVIDLDGNVLVWNKAAEAISGYSSLEVTGHSKIWEWLYPDSKYRKQIMALPSDSQVEIETNIKRKNGDAGVISWKERPLYGNGGELIGSIVIGRDITQRKQAEEKLRESEERYRSLYENSAEGILLTTTDGRILAANPEACSILQRTEAEIRQIGRDGVVDLTDPRLQVALEERARTGTFKGELTLKRKDGSRFPAEVATSVFKARTEPEATCMVIRDISERKQMEDRLNSIHEHGLRLAFAKRIDEIIKHTLDAMEFTLGFRVADFALSEDTRFRIKESRGLATSVLELSWDGPGIIVKAANTKNTIKVDDTREEPAYVDLEGRSGVDAVHDILSEIAVPVLVGDEALAVLDVQSTSLNAFTAKDVVLLETLAGHVASALTRLRQQDELTRYSEHLEEMVKERTSQLAESELRFRDLANLLPQIVFETDERGNYTFVNRSGIASAGYAEDEVRAGLNALQTFIEEDRSRIKENIARVLSGEDLGANEYTALRKDGTTFPVLIHSTRVIREGKPVGLRGIAMDITERKRSEEALRESEERFSQAMDATSDGLWDWNVETDEIYFSPGYNRMLGYEPGVLTEKIQSWKDRIHPDDLDRAVRANEDCIENRIPRFQVEFRMKTKGGEWIWVLGRGRATSRGPNGRALRMIGTHQDITARKKMEEELQASRERLDYIITSNPAHIFLAKPLPDLSDYYSTFQSKNTLSITGYESEEFIGEKGAALWASRVHPDDLASYRAGVADFWKQGHRTFEYRFLHKNGTYRWIMEEANVIRDATGTVRDIIGYNTDITELKRMEEELRAAKDQLEYVVASNPAVLFLEKPFPDKSNTFATFVSENAITVLGFESKIFLGEAGEEFWKSRVHTDDLVRYLSEMPSLWRDGHHTFEFRFLHSDGTYRWIREEMKVNRDAQGHILDVVAVDIDLTERKKLEDKLAKAERLAAVGQAAAMVGHDLRNPLQATTAAIYLLRKLLDSGKREDLEEALRLLDELDKQTYYMDKIVSDLQDYTRPVETESIETNLLSLINDVTSIAQVPKNIQVSTVIQGDLTRMMVNPSLLKRVLVNLVINGTQAMPNGGKLTITATRAQKSVTIAIQDNGEGIAQDNLGKLFNPFFTTKAKGQGLGLAVSKRLVEAQGGTITVQSELGKGSTFTVSIPT
jgi:PAS domain S-box-containing protein